MRELGCILRLEYGEALPSTRRSGFGYPVYGSNGVVGYHSILLVSGPGIIVGRKGSVGRISWCDTGFWPIDTTYYVVSLVADINWLHHVLDWLPLQELDSSTGVPGLNRNDVYRLRVFDPHITEQRLIAKILDTLDNQIQKTEALIAKLEQIKQGLLHDLLTRGIDENGELRPSPEQVPNFYKNSLLGEIPKAWYVDYLNEFLRGIDAGWSPSCPDEPPRQGQWGVLKVSAVSSGVYRPTESKALPRELLPIESLEVQRNDVLITRANGVADLVGRTVFVVSTPPRLMLSDKTLRLQSNPNKVTPFFLSMILSSQPVRRQIVGFMGGSSGQKNISQMQIRGLTIAAPPLREQQRMQSYITVYDTRVQTEHEVLMKLRETKTGLMNDLLTGRVRVTPLLEEKAEAATA